ncbi:hypothetical protein PQR34_46800, partial [Paraburkholderia sediminicola]|uniref:hypothetical protein n=1 Tax=Paraburkholderia sediminicola TaxID=458836 RepID=UPI0038BAD639
MARALKTVIGLASQGKAYSIMPLVRAEPELASLMSKLIPGRAPPSFTQLGEMKPGEPDVFELRNLANRTARNITDAETVMEMLPETDLAATILISCVLSPKDMMTQELTFSAPENSTLPPDVSGAMVTRLSQFFETDYKIAPLLPTMLRDILVQTGSYPVAVIPENAIDEVINNNRAIKLEDLASEINSDGSMRNRGFLRNPDVQRERKVALGAS